MPLHTVMLMRLTIGIAFIVAVSMWAVVYSIQAKAGTLTVVFLNVGQGDSIFIESPVGLQVLIDGGRDRSVLRALSRYMPFYDRHIDMLVATHPDADHISGLIDVLQRYEVNALVHSGVMHDTPMSQSLFALAAQHSQGHKRHNVSFTESIAKRGTVYDLGGGALLRVLFPDREATHFETNTASLVMRLEYGDTSVLLTGDSPQEIENYLVSLYGTTLQSDILKLGHHGSKTSSSENFIGYVSPTWGIVSAGKDNEYGHPHKEVITRLERFGVVIKNTAAEGSIVFKSNGEQWLTD